MRSWNLAISLDPGQEQPLFLQLANAIAESIRRGVLKPGEALPGSRKLANHLGINRNTVIAGYEELVAEGLVNTYVGRGTFIASAPARLLAPNTPPSPDLPTYPLDPAWPVMSLPETFPPGMLVLSHALPDIRLLPENAMARAFRRAIGHQNRDMLACTNPYGHMRLRTQLAKMLTHTRGLPTNPDDVLVTRNIEHGIDLIARTLIKPGDTVAVEAFGYPSAWRVLGLAGARLLPIAVSDDGLDVDALEARLSYERLRAVLLTPHHQFPTTTVMSPAKRERLAELATRHHFAIIELNEDHELHYEGKPVLPIAAGAGHANVIHVGSLANLLAPGLSMGFVVVPPSVLEPLANLHATCHARESTAIECAIAELFEDGEILRHVRRVRRAYARRRDALASALTKHLGNVIDFHVAEGGMALWVRVDEEINVASWTHAAKAQGVHFRDAKAYDFHHRDESHMRLAFSWQNETELEVAVQRMAHALGTCATMLLTIGILPGAA